MSGSDETAVLLSSLAEWRIWCAWQSEDTDTRKRVKTPYAVGYRGKSNTPETWLTLAEARSYAPTLPKPYGEGGIGVYLGNFGQHQKECGWSLGGIDYDSCFDTFGLAEWAQEAVRLVPTYGEISQSGAGFKQYFLFPTSELDALRAALGMVGENQKGRKWAQKSDGEHPPAIEIYLGNRFFAITGDQMPDLPATMRPVSMDVLLAVKRLAEKLTGKADAPPRPAPSPVRAVPKEGTLAERLTIALTQSTRLARLWSGDLSGESTVDHSRSNLAFYLVGQLQGAGFDEAEVEDLLTNHPLTADWMATKAFSNGGREWDRVWGRAPTGIPMLLDPLPVVPGLSIGDVRPEGAMMPGWLPPFSDAALALRALRQHGEDMRYVAGWGQWLTWCGSRWQKDTTLVAMERIKETCKEAAGEAGKALASGVASNKTVRAVESMARSDRRVASTTSAWDQDPWLLNTPGGTVDLRTGRLRECARADLITRQTTVTPDFGMDCPLWRKFLRTVTGGALDLEEYLGRVAGYCLTGLTVEHSLFFLHGTGRNGKGTFAHTLRNLLGDYAVYAESSTFAASRGDRHMTELARLDGARLVVTSETEEGRAWNESRIKQLTGGDPVTANFMRQDHFTFLPQFKLVMLGNHKPRLNAVDDAMKARIKLAPFTVFVPPEERDKDLQEKMIAGEGPGILAWMVRGCREWQRLGLAAPASVTSATDAYIDAEDSRTTWFNECCEDLRETSGSENVGTRMADIFASWRVWAEKANEFVGNQKAIVEWVNQKGFKISNNNLNQKVVARVRLLTMGSLQTNNNVAEKSGFAAPPAPANVHELKQKKPEN